MSNGVLRVAGVCAAWLLVLLPARGLAASWGSLPGLPWRPAPTEAQPASVAEPVIVHARDAEIHGKSAHYEKSRDRDNIGFWTNAADWVSWPAELTAPGRYQVRVTYACPANTAGSTYTVEVGGERVTGIVASTGSWGTFVTEAIGVVDCPAAGAQTIAVKVVEKKGGAVMNLQAVTLQPGNWEPGLVAWWRLDAGEGAVARDCCVGVDDAAEHCRWVREGSISALKFNGYSSAIRRPSPLPLLPPDTGLAVEVWFRPDAPPDTWQALVNQHSYPLGFYFGFDAGGALTLQLAADGGWVSCRARAELPAQHWHHLAAAYDPAAGLTLYVNGVPVNRQDATGDFAPADDVDLLIGRHNSHPWSLHGALDDVRLYRRPLAEDEVARHYQEGLAAHAAPLPIAFRSVSPTSRAAQLYERLALRIELDATYDNPFDADDISIDAEVQAPSGRRYRVPGFFYQPYRRRLEAGEETVSPDGDASWQVRLSFAEPGVHLVTVIARDRTGTARSGTLRLRGLPADVPGVVRCSPRDHRYFVTERGESFFPVGANICWADGLGTFAYDQWLPRYAGQQCNFFRVWLSPLWATLALNTEASGCDGIDQMNAWRLDHVLATATALGLRAMLCIDSFNILRGAAGMHGNWEEAPFSRTGGGRLGEPMDYFTDEDARRDYRNRLRYLVARYGYSPDVFAWEFWNEVDLVDGYDAKVVAAWHADMARYLRQLDPWKHMITTSVASDTGDKNLEQVPELDFLQTHSYRGIDMAEQLNGKRSARQNEVAKPHFHGEFGISGSGEDTALQDPKGIHLHNALFASIGAEEAGAPMTWWWDLYIDPQNLYPIFGAFSSWIDGFDFVAQEPKPVQAAAIEAPNHPARPGVLQPVPGSWDAAPYNLPISASVDATGLMTHDRPISDLLHGVGFHKDLHNPVTFHIVLEQPSGFSVELEKRSGYGPSALQISLDGKVALKKAFAVPEETSQTTLFDAAGMYTVKVPAGRHTIKVENTGEDWLSVAAYHVPGFVDAQCGVAPLRVSGLMGRSMGLVWVQNKRYTWFDATAYGFSAQPVTGAELRLEDVPPGRWLVHYHDTGTGSVSRTRTRSVGSDGALTVPLPDIVWDAALRLERLQ